MLEQLKMQRTQKFYRVSFVIERTQLNAAHAWLEKKLRLNVIDTAEMAPIFE